MKTHTYALALILCSSSAAALDCTQPANDMQAQICADPALSDLAALADDVGNAVGLSINYENFDVLYEIYPRFARLLTTLTVQDMDILQSTDQSWTFDFNADNKLLIINTSGSPLQNMLVTFGPDDNVTYVETLPHDDAGQYDYELVGNILEITESFAPASSTKKYRNQDGCWRLIGQDSRWRDEDPYKSSINVLTGQAIFDYKDGTTTNRTFDTQITCLGADFYTHNITYHDSE